MGVCHTAAAAAAALQERSGVPSDTYNEPSLTLSLNDDEATPTPDRQTDRQWQWGVEYYIVAQT